MYRGDRSRKENSSTTVRLPRRSTTGAQVRGVRRMARQTIFVRRRRRLRAGRSDSGGAVVRPTGLIDRAWRCGGIHQVDDLLSEINCARRVTSASSSRRSPSAWRRTDEYLREHGVKVRYCIRGGNVERVEIIRTCASASSTCWWHQPAGEGSTSGVSLCDPRRDRGFLRSERSLIRRWAGPPGISRRPSSTPTYDRVDAQAIGGPTAVARAVAFNAPRGSSRRRPKRIKDIIDACTTPTTRCG